MPQKRWEVTDEETGHKTVIVSDTAPTEAQAVEALGKSMKPHFPADRPFPAVADTTDPGATRQRLVQQAPMLGAMAAGAATGGASIPLGMLAEGAGAAAGSATGDVLAGRNVDLPHAAGEGAMFAAGSGVIRGLRQAKDIGKSLWSRMSGEVRPQIIEDITSRGLGAPTKVNSSALYAEQRANAPQVAEGVQAPSDPLLEAANAHYRITKNTPPFLDYAKRSVATGAGIGGGVGALTGSPRNAAIGSSIGGALGAAGSLTHPAIGMRAGQALINMNILPKVAQEANPAVATETMRQLVALMMRGGNGQ